MALPPPPPAAAPLVLQSLQTAQWAAPRLVEQLVERWSPGLLSQERRHHQHWKEQALFQAGHLMTASRQLVWAQVPRKAALRTPSQPPQAAEKLLQRPPAGERLTARELRPARRRGPIPRPPPRTTRLTCSTEEE